MEQALHARRSLRSYSRAALALEEAAQLLWAAQGVTSPSGYRTAPSAGALYPLETLLCAGRIDGLPPGVYRYRPDRHDLIVLAEGDRRAELAAAALSQGWVREAPAVVALAAVYRRVTGRYLQRGVRYAWMEAGHAAQNVLLQAAALGLGGVPVGAFDDRAVARVLRLSSEEEPLYLIPVGRR
ncbi:MAG: SagB/ThcOx family dehydrogenase [Bryobacteraceae bacterium]|nr:SagB/ThcOx family dehydrogenase [Bryobacteraceae bacterium]MCX7603265.1 SagB/ThcOx family dehydrogenase [Bryobacteraceae bacterium]